MFIIIFLCIGLISSESHTSKFYFSGFQNSFKAIYHRLATSNIIVSAPHAGSDMPTDIPDRVVGGCRRNNSNACTFYYNDSCFNGTRCSITTVQDFADFDPFAEQLVDELYTKHGLLSSAIIAKWNRNKVDFNREINEATFNHPKVIRAYQRYHNYLERAITKIHRNHNGSGLLLDVHQHAQGNYTMIGMRLSAVQLNNDDLSPTSIESLIASSCPDNRNECIRGSKAFGTFLELNDLGISYPSLNNPKPNNKTFYKGGYITNHYSSKINVIQNEFSYVVRNEFQPKVFIEKYAQAVVSFMKANKLL